ncbi:Spy0128 family protein [Berryella intestinalis]|uniref:Spy0128 family protein n=1 Tax=Berryella intestinalis TaxID=1531429 RepID=UPI0039BFE86E
MHIREVPVGGTKDHRASFGEAAFATPGVYSYEVKEVPGNLANVTYDSNAYKVVVTVSDGANGTLAASVAYPMAWTAPCASPIRTRPCLPTINPLLPSIMGKRPPMRRRLPIR